MTDSCRMMIMDVSGSQDPERSAIDCLSRLQTSNMSADEMALIRGVLLTIMGKQVEASDYLQEASLSSDSQVSYMAGYYMARTGKALISSGFRLHSEDYEQCITKTLTDLIEALRVAGEYGAHELGLSLFESAYLAWLEWSCVTKSYGPGLSPWTGLATGASKVLAGIRAGGLELPEGPRAMASTLASCRDLPIETKRALAMILSPAAE